MNQEWKLVPVVPTKEMMLNDSACQHHDHDDLSCIQRNMRRGIWDKMIAAAPVPPAGSEVPTAAIICSHAVAAIPFGVMGDPVKYGAPLVDLPMGTKLVDRAHVTRLTAENARLQAELERFQRANSAMADELNQANIRAIAAEELLDAGPSYADGTHPNQYEADLETEAEEAREQLELIGNLIPEEYEPNGSELDCLTAYLGDLQSDLTKARELLSEVCYSIANRDHYRKVFAYLAHQSAPAVSALSAENQRVVKPEPSITAPHPLEVSMGPSARSGSIQSAPAAKGGGDDQR
jgi:hypothetical protein